MFDHRYVNNTMNILVHRKGNAEFSVSFHSFYDQVSSFLHICPSVPDSVYHIKNIGALAAGL